MGSNEDHDLLIKIDQKMSSLMENYENHLVAFREHSRNDSEQFDTLKRFIYMGLGGLCAMEIILKLWGRG